MIKLRRSAFRRFLLAFLAPLLALTACVERSAESPEAVVVVDSAGVALVTNYRAQWPEGSGWQIDSVPRTSLGGVEEADSNQHWSYIDAATLLSDGRVVLTIDGELRWFGPDGTHLLTARAGDGPGEFRYIEALYATPGDSVRAYGSGGTKHAVFAADGSLAYERQTDTDKLRALGPWSQCSDKYLVDGSHLLCQSDASIPVTASNRPNRETGAGHSSPGPGHLRQLHRVWLVSPSLDRAYPLGVGAGSEQYGISMQGSTRFVSHPFYSRSISAAGGDPMRIATALNPEYRIELWTPEGTLERVIMREGARRAPTSVELADAKDRMRRQSTPDGLPIGERAVAEVPVPDSLPAMQDMAITPRGELLVLREGHLPSHTRSEYDVFDREGIWLGSFRLQDQRRIVDVRDDTMLMYRMSEDGAWLVEVYGYQR